MTWVTAEREADADASRRALTDLGVTGSRFVRGRVEVHRGGYARISLDSGLQR